MIYINHSGTLGDLRSSITPLQHFYFFFLCLSDAPPAGTNTGRFPEEGKGQGKMLLSLCYHNPGQHVLWVRCPLYTQHPADSFPRV